MTRMVVSSFYNTLINKEEAIPTSTMLEIDRIRHNNILFVVITNRLLKDVLYYNNDFPFIDYIICLNGSIIYDVNNNKIIYEKSIDKKTINNIKEQYKNNKITYYTKDNYYNELINEDIYKIEIEVNKKDLNKNNSIFKYNNKYYIEINSTSIYDSLKVIMKKENIKQEEITTIIGNLSEKELINKIDNTYVVSNSMKELKELANNKTKSNDKKGLEQVIKTI